MRFQPANLPDMLVHPSRYEQQLRVRAAELVEKLLSWPMTPEDAAHELDVSKQTVHTWLEAGYLAEAEGSRPTHRLLDRSDVLSAAELLRRAREAGHTRNLVALLREGWGRADVEELPNFFAQSIELLGDDDIRPGVVDGAAAPSIAARARATHSTARRPQGRRGAAKRVARAGVKARR